MEPSHAGRDAAVTYAGVAEVQFFEHERYSGSLKHYCSGTDNERSGFWPHLAYVCPLCGELWCRAIYQFEFQYNPLPRANWKTREKYCPTCGDGFLLEGRPLEEASEELLRRELQLYLTQRGI